MTTIRYLWLGLALITLGYPGHISADNTVPDDTVTRWQAILNHPKTSLVDRQKAIQALSQQGQAALVVVPDLFRVIASETRLIYPCYLALNQIIVNPLHVLNVLEQALQSKYALIQMIAGQHLGRLLFEQETIKPSDPTAYAKGIAMWGKLPGVPTWIWVASLTETAAYYLKKQDIPRTLQALQLAIQQGYDDYYLFVEEPSWKQLHNNPGFQKLYAAMKMSPADQHEYFWLIRERKHVQHETTMLITHNIGRKDTQMTSVYQVPLPNRPTTSFAITSRRWWLAWQQNVERAMVMSSDLSRRSHLLNMQIIRNIGSGNSYRQQYLHRMAGMNSLRLAQARARQQQLAAIQRQYRLPVGISTEPQALPPLSSFQNPSK